eukprot:1692929-Prymnesium_polylepis.1
MLSPGRCRCSDPRPSRPLHLREAAAGRPAGSGHSTPHAPLPGCPARGPAAAAAAAARCARRANSRGCWRPRPSSRARQARLS